VAADSAAADSAAVMAGTTGEVDSVDWVGAIDELRLQFL
tara:strand:- start:3063 stop:3179 length:117 start_codon:yes stop_codon:yes gene_type:complete